MITITGEPTFYDYLRAQSYHRRFRVLLISGILGIFFYNFFVNKVDAFNYTTDEATFEVLQLLKAKQTE